MRRLFAMAILLLLAGCASMEDVSFGGEGEPAAAPEPPDYTYDIVVKDIYSAPDYPQLTENYKVRTIVQIYGQYLPSGYSVWVLDGNKTILKEDITNPELLEYFEFSYYAGNTEPHHFRVEVQSLDSAHPEPEENLANNILREDISAYPFGYYDIYNWRVTWFYDAVGMQVYQAQAFTLERPLNVSRIGVYVQASVPPPEGSKLKVSLHEKPNSWGNIGLGATLAEGEIDATQITSEPAWHHVEFGTLELSNDTYWIMLSYDSPSSAGVEWYRAQGDQYGVLYDTQMIDRAGYGEWEYKNFDFAFTVD